MADPVAVQARPDVVARLGAFVLERYPFAIVAASAAVAKLGGAASSETATIARLRGGLTTALRAALQSPPAELPECTPAVASAARWNAAVDELVEACEGFLRRAEIRASLTRDERVEILRGMILTRATDNRLKAFFTGGEVRYKETTFQGKGFRSLGQEAIYAAGIRLRRGAEYETPDGWRGDVIAPIIRDLGLELAMSPGPERTGEMIRRVLSAQMGKAGPPMDGRDLHVGDFDRGILPAAAPLGTGALTLTGMAMAFAQQADGRVAIPLVGDGATSLGEWHEAINLCAVRKLPAVFCVQNNQTALSTPLADQTAVRVFADKAAGYGIPGITIDGTDPDEIAAAFAWAVERAREGKGPAIVELVSMRMCGHAHHDDMLYLGKDPQPSWSYPPLAESGYANPALYAYWRERDPLVTYAARLEAEGLIAHGDVERMLSLIHI